MTDLRTASARPLTRDQAQALVDAVMEAEGLALSASAYEDTGGGWVFEATCDSAPDLDAFGRLAREVLGGDVVFSADRIDPKVDWVAKSLEGLRPVLAGGFYVHGGHDTAPAPAGATPIHIEAAQAFGTGHHETTAGCLEAIDRLARQRRFRRVIDVGTGTGVLAIAIAKRMRVDVLATDIDPVAVRTAAENARGNGVGSAVTAVEADGLHHPRIKAGAPYELIVANILAGPLVGLAPAMGRIAERGAAIVLSGLLTSQAPRVQAAYARQGMFLVERFPRGEWSTLVLEKR